MTLAVSGQTLVGLDECYSRLEVSPRIPGCCAHEEAPTVEDVHRSCCRMPFVTDGELSSTTASNPDVARAALAVVHAPIGQLRDSLGPDPRGFRPIVERPPDRAPPTRTTVLLI
jgi:hypothetical protein